jgi:hypothetical protein
METRKGIIRIYPEAERSNFIPCRKEDRSTDRLKADDSL